MEKSQLQTAVITPRKRLDTQVKQYILDMICCDGYDNMQGEQMVLHNDKEALQFLHNTFIGEYGWAIERYGEQKAFSEWIKGLPMSFNIAFTNHDILKLAIKWGYYGSTLSEKQEEKILDNYWNLITVKTFQLFKKYGVL